MTNAPILLNLNLNLSAKGTPRALVNVGSPPPDHEFLLNLTILYPSTVSSESAETIT